MSQQGRERYDVAVVGGGAAGIAAAVGAARLGARTILIERYGFLGGAATNANVLSYCGFYAQGHNPEPAVGGVGQDALRHLAGFGNDVTPVRAPSGNWIVMIDPEALKAGLDALTLSAGLDLRLHALLVGAESSNDRIDAIRVADHRGAFEVEADAFVDASGEADLAARAGATMRSADGERLQSASFPVRFSGGEPGATIDRALITELIASLPAPAGPASLRANGGVFLRLSLTDDLWWMGIDVATDGLSSADLSKAERSCRALAWGFLSVLRRHPGFERANILSTGPQVGIRETRHPAARHTISREEAGAGTKSSSGVARAAWPMEVHAEAGKPTFVPIGGDGYFHVPLEALRSSEFGNLWFGGRVIGADPWAYGSIRVMGTGFATGHAAGIAAAKGDADVAAIRAAIADQNGIL